MINLKGINRKNKRHVQYPDVPSVIRLIPHNPDLPFPEPEGDIEYSSDSEHSDITVADGDDEYKPEEADQLLLLTQAKLNNLMRNLNLSKGSAQLLGSRLEEKHLLSPGTKFYWYQEGESEFRHVFTFQD